MEPLINSLKNSMSLLDWRIQIIYEVSSAMSYLHGQKPVVIHGDLTCKNILVGDRFCAKIAYFGMARFLKDYYSSKELLTLKDYYSSKEHSHCT